MTGTTRSTASLAKESDMPLTLTISEGVLPSGREREAFSRLCELMLKWHGLTGNETMRSNVVGSLHVVPRGTTFTGMQDTDVVFIEWKVPSFAFTDRKVQVGYFEDAANLIHDMSGGRQPKDRIFINVVHAVDGAWNFGGRALTNAEIATEVAKG
jgi:hypothetical protein